MNNIIKESVNGSLHLSDVLSKDIQDIITDVNISWSQLKNAHVLITGATGMIGGMLIKVLCLANQYHHLSLQIVGQGRNHDALIRLQQDYGIHVIEGDICNYALFEDKIDQADYVFHCAGITRSKDMIEKPVDVMNTSLTGTMNILQLIKKCQTTGMVYLSSMEVYGQTDLEEVCEEDLGYIDLSNPRSCYPVSKRACEALCHAYISQYHLPIKVARLAQTFGAGTSQTDTRVYAQFARSAIRRENITLHTDGSSRGNYCYLADAIRALLLLLLKGTNGETYNIAGDSATIREMAELVAQEYHVQTVIDIPQNKTNYGYAQPVHYRLNTSKLHALGWTAQYGLLEAYRRMIWDWQNMTGCV
jgi:nucleoside-diphosphate-sugar epimerase